MGFFDRFGKSFDDKVAEAITAMKAMNLGISMAMQKLDEMVAPDNIVNAIKVAKPAPAPAPEPAPAAAAERFHDVVAGDTLGHIAQKYYGKASAYMKIFEANRDILDDPNLIKVGQRLRIPE
jgi:nucleoid-associated protein YgaU